MMNEALLTRLDRALATMGGTHSLEDIVELIKDGQMQSFVRGDTWAVTQIFDMPRKRVLEVVLVVGEMAEAEAMHDEILAYARDQGCDLVRTLGRDGWGRQARAHGWRNGQRVFVKEL